MLLKIIEPINQELKHCKNKWTNDDYFYFMDLTKKIHDRIEEIKSR